MNLNNRKNLLLFSLAAETFLASYGLGLGSQTSVVSILYVLAAVLVIISILILPDARFLKTEQLKNESLLKLPLVGMMVLLAFIVSRYWLDEIPIDTDFADMLPVIRVMNQRFLHGDWKQVYDPIHEIWNGAKPIYLPAMWLPYSPAIAFHFDMRWVTVCAVLVSFIVILLLTRIRKNRYYGYGLITIMALLFWWIFARNDVHGLVSMSEEGVIIFYFVLLTLAVISGNAFLMGVAAALCLLSRYSMIGWVAPCLIFLAARKDLRKGIVFSVTGACCFFLLLIFPFGFKILGRMIAVPGNYVAFAKQVWAETPEVYWLNLGMAKFYGPHRIAALHFTLIAATFIIPLLFLCGCLFQKQWKLQNINLACFKLSLLVFYQFIDVPYGYLFYTCSFVSLAIGAVLLE